MEQGEGGAWGVGRGDSGVLCYILGNCTNFHKHTLLLESKQKVSVNSLRYL